MPLMEVKRLLTLHISLTCSIGRVCASSMMQEILQHVRGQTIGGGSSSGGSGAHCGCMCASSSQSLQLHHFPHACLHAAPSQGLTPPGCNLS